MDNRVNNTFWVVTSLAAAMLMVTMGARQSMGLFVFPLVASTGLGYQTISLAMAVAQFVWGAIQPISGALADRYGAAPILIGGVLLLSIGCAITPFMTSAWGLILSIGLLSAAGSGAGSLAVLTGVIAQRIPMERRGIATGIINAGGSFGQFVFAPLLQMLITLLGWISAMWSLAVIVLAVLPIGWALRQRPLALVKTPNPNVAVEPMVKPKDGSLKSALRQALADRSYLLLHAGFFTCGFHIAFLVTHLPGEIHLCGLPAQVASWSLAIIGLANIAGSLFAGWGIQHYRSKYLLFWMYSARAVLIVLYLLMPKTVLTFYMFAIGLGFTWLGTVPPTASIVSKLFGTRYLATLFGLTLLSHQIGGFFGAWVGGIVFETTGNYNWVWGADILLAIFAALCNLPIREARIAIDPKPV